MRASTNLLPWPQDRCGRTHAHQTQMDESPPRPTSRRTLIIDDADRYSRLRLIPWWRQDRLAAARVLVVGAGPWATRSSRTWRCSGVGTVYVIDLDTVEPSNLSRSVLFRAEDGGQPKAEVAARRAARSTPTSRFIPIHGDVITDLGLGLFADVDVVIGCLDNREARLWVNRQCWKVGTPWVDAGIQEIQGVVKVFVPPDSACYECAMTEPRLPAPEPALQLPPAPPRPDSRGQGPDGADDRLDDGGPGGAGSARS